MVDDRRQRRGRVLRGMVRHVRTRRAAVGHVEHVRVLAGTGAIDGGIAHRGVRIATRSGDVVVQVRQLGVS